MLLKTRSKEGTIFWVRKVLRLSSLVSGAIALASLPVLAGELLPKDTFEQSPIPSPIASPEENLPESHQVDPSSKPALALKTPLQLHQGMPLQGKPWSTRSVDLRPQAKPASEAIVEVATASKAPVLMGQGTPNHSDAANAVRNESVPNGTLTAQAASPFNSDVAQERWQFLVEPYLFVPFDVKADITVRGRKASLEAGLGELFELDRIFAASLRLEARKNRLGFIVDGSYLSVGKDGNLDVTIPAAALRPYGINTDVNLNAGVSANVHQGVLDLAVFYRVIDQSLGRNPGSNPYPRLTAEPILGVRLNWLGQEIDVGSIRIGGINIPNQDVKLSAFFAEPMLGFRAGLELSDRWGVGIRADVSGFNINADRDFTWNLLIGTQYRLSSKVALQLAYRFTKFEYQDGKGTDRLGLDLRQQGLWLGAVFSF
ncbi:outer membrane protein [Stenomitos frigidus]|nr:porin family protein [Stenomitos frigidus]